MYELVNRIGNAWIAVQKTSKRYDFVSVTGELNVTKNESTMEEASGRSGSIEHAFKSESIDHVVKCYNYLCSEF